jgi:hypothetical protein
MLKFAGGLMALAVLSMGPCPWLSGRWACPPVFIYGVTVVLTDAQTGAPITEATLMLTDGSYTEQMQVFPSGSYVGAGGRPGNYTLTIEAAGFHSQTRTDIVVTSDPCNVIPVTLEVALTPL